MPSPLQISHLKEFQQPQVDSASYCQILNSEEQTCAPKNPLFLGILHFAYLKSVCVCVCFFFLYTSRFKRHMIELCWGHQCNDIDTLRCLCPESSYQNEKGKYLDNSIWNASNAIDRCFSNKKIKKKYVATKVSTHTSCKTMCLYLELYSSSVKLLS